jgi:hypothetical protein
MRRYAEAGSDEWANLVCWRIRGPFSLWKRIGDFPGNLREWNRRLPAVDDLDAVKAWKDASAQLATEGVLVVRHADFRPWRSRADDPLNSQVSIVQSNSSLVPITVYSPVVASLLEAWESDIQVQAFSVSDGGLSVADVIERLVPPSSGEA